MAVTLKKTYLLASEKKWHDDLFQRISRSTYAHWYRIDNKDDFTLEKIQSISPDIIFIPHWSYIIPNRIYEQYQCIVFHMTDLPFGRGGSPLQNLIARGLEKTVITAIKVTKGIDTGDIYLKMPLELSGTAKEIFIRASFAIEKMIGEIISNNILPIPQEGEVTLFKRRTQKDGDINELTELNQVYNFIRMLDCEGYPNAYLETTHFKFEFSKAAFTDNQSVTANVRITKK